MTNISRIHFKDGRGYYAGAINIGYNAIVTLEVCIFSGNQTIDGNTESYGGAIYAYSQTKLIGCTFYNNAAASSYSYGGAIYFDYGVPLTLVGNVFYNNTANTGPIVWNRNGIKGISLGYNAVDVAQIDYAGWDAATGDTTFADLGITDTPINTTTFAPVYRLGSVIPNPPPAGFPTTDFYGNPRTFPDAPGAVTDNSTSCSVTFNSNDGSTVNSMSVNPGDTITKPADPTKAGHIFGGWYKEATFITPWNFATDTVTTDIILYAKWIAPFTVSFDSQGGSDVDPISVYPGNTITKPADPTKAGHTFDAWYKETAFTNQWNFATETVAANTTLYAGWLADKTVTFNADSGIPAPAPQTVTHGSTITAPSAMTKAGYIFDAWYRESTFISTWNFATDTVTGDTALYAKWVTTYTVTFNADSGNPAPVQQTVASGGKITEPPAMTKTNFNFGGWYKEDTFTNTWNFATDTVTSAITLYAKWNIIQYTVTYHVNTGSGAVPTAQTVDAGTSVTLPNGNGLSKSDNIFCGWLGDNSRYSAGSSFTPTGDITLYANWGALKYDPINNNTAYRVSGGTVWQVAVVIPATYNGLPVTEIGSANDGSNNGAFDRTNITAITIPTSVTTIGGYAFYYCSGLTTINIPTSVTTIGNYAFYYCSGLTAITVPASVTSIGDYAFHYCSALTSVTFGGSATSIGNNAFPQGGYGPGGNNLRDAYLSGGAGTYTRTTGGSAWTKQ